MADDVRVKTELAKILGDAAPFVESVTTEDIDVLQEEPTLVEDIEEIDDEDLEDDDDFEDDEDIEGDCYSCGGDACDDCGECHECDGPCDDEVTG